jgi:hypothetical protein
LRTVLATIRVLKVQPVDHIRSHAGRISTRLASVRPLPNFDNNCSA